MSPPPKGSAANTTWPDSAAAHRLPGFALPPMRVASRSALCASRPPMVALAAEDAAIALARTGGVGGARPFLDRALVTFEGIGAARDVARVEARMRALNEAYEVLSDPARRARYHASHPVQIPVRTTRPNGPDCPPVCRVANARLDVALGTLEPV